MVGLESTDFFLGEAEREVDRIWVTAGTSFEEPALLKEYEGLLVLTPRVLDLEGGAKGSELFGGWNC